MKRKKISENDIAAIKSSPLTVREAALFFHRSPTTIVKIRKGGRPVVKKTKSDRRSLSESEKVVFIEAARISRYSIKMLCEFLAPVYSRLPTIADRNKVGLSDLSPSHKVSEKTLHRILSRAKLKLTMTGTGFAPGTVAIHRIQISWPKKNEKGREGAELLCLMERCSGTVFLKAYNRVDCGAVKKCLSEFNTFCRLKNDAVVFLGSRERWNFKERPRKANSGQVLLSLPDAIREDFRPRPTISHEDFPDGIPPSELSIETPFASISEFNDMLITLANNYIFADRFDEHGEKKERFRPAARHWDAYQCEENVADFNLRSRISDKKQFERKVKILKHPRQFKADPEKVNAERR